MAVIEDFFNRSAFMVSPLTSNLVIEPNVAFDYNVYVLDYITGTVATSVTGKLYVKDGRNSTLVADTPTITLVAGSVWNITGTILSSEWTTQDIIIELDIVDANSKIHRYALYLVGKE